MGTRAQTAGRKRRRECTLAGTGAALRFSAPTSHYVGSHLSRGWSVCASRQTGRPDWRSFADRRPGDPHTACRPPGQLVQRFRDFRSLSFCITHGKPDDGLSFLRSLPPLSGLNKDTPFSLLCQGTIWETAWQITFPMLSTAFSVFSAVQSIAHQIAV